MKILLLLSESWNDVFSPNNNMTNWFYNMQGVEIATVSGSGTVPNNSCCKKYFLISENDMIKSIFFNIKAGRCFSINEETPMEMYNKKNSIDISENVKVKKIFRGELARLIQDIVWRFGRIDIGTLAEFINAFSPDVIFSQRRGSVKMCRLEEIITGLCSAPLVVYTGDDDYSLHQFSVSPVFWVRRLWARKWIRYVSSKYQLLYCQSYQQMKEYENELGLHTAFLVKSGNFSEEKVHDYLHDPIRLVYAGKLYCNRWKTLYLISEAIREVNSECGRVHFVLEIFTKDNVSKKQRRLLNDGKQVFLQPSIDPKQLEKVYQKSDIALHVEGLDLKNKLLTQYSFSTKVMDCLSSGCAVMVVSWEKHSAYSYLETNDVAFVGNSKESIKKVLQNISANPKTVILYAERAYQYGLRNHAKEKIQDLILENMKRIVEK